MWIHLYPCLLQVYEPKAEKFGRQFLNPQNLNETIMLHKLNIRVLIHLLGYILTLYDKSDLHFTLDTLMFAHQLFIFTIGLRPGFETTFFFFLFNHKTLYGESHFALMIYCNLPNICGTLEEK